MPNGKLKILNVTVASPRPGGPVGSERDKKMLDERRDIRQFFLVASSGPGPICTSNWSDSRRTRSNILPQP